MEAYINIDISKNSRPTSYAFKYNQNPSPSIKFLIHNGNYVFDMSNFNELRLNINMREEQISRSFTLDSSNIVVENSISYVLWDIPIELSDELDVMTVMPTVRIDNVTLIDIDSFKITFYENSDDKLDLTLKAINDFNKAYATYLTAVKSFEYESPNGVPKLDENGIVKWKQIPYYRHKRQTMADTLYDIDQLHGMKINRETLEWMYYDNDDNFWYFVNQVYGGGFDRDNKQSSYDIYGGEFLLPLTDDFISANTFTDIAMDIIDGSTYSDLPSDFIIAGTYSEAVPTVQPKLFGGLFKVD